MLGSAAPRMVMHDGTYTLHSSNTSMLPFETSRQVLAHTLKAVPLAGAILVPPPTGLQEVKHSASGNSAEFPAAKRGIAAARFKVQVRGVEVFPESRIASVFFPLPRQLGRKGRNCSARDGPSYHLQGGRGIRTEAAARRRTDSGIAVIGHSSKKRTFSLPLASA